MLVPLMLAYGTSLLRAYPVFVCRFFELLETAMR